MSLGALTPIRTWFPLTPKTVTVTSFPIITVSPTRLVSINMLRLLAPVACIAEHLTAFETVAVIVPSWTNRNSTRHGVINQSVRIQETADRFSHLGEHADS